jgi:hypothetical protein
MLDDAPRGQDHWHLTPDEQRLVEAKRRASQLGFAVLLVFFRERGRFPRDTAEVDAQAIRVLSEQLDLPLPADKAAFLRERTAERLRAEIRIRFGFREATVADADNLTSWLCDQVIGTLGSEIAPLIERLEGRCRALSLEPPTIERMERIARSAVRAYDDRFHARTLDRLSSATRKRLDALLSPEETDEAAAEDEASRPALLSIAASLAHIGRLRAFGARACRCARGLRRQGFGRGRAWVTLIVKKHKNRLGLAMEAGVTRQCLRCPVNVPTPAAKMTALRIRTCRPDAVAAPVSQDLECLADHFFFLVIAISAAAPVDCSSDIFFRDPHFESWLRVTVAARLAPGVWSALQTTSSFL